MLNKKQENEGKRSKLMCINISYKTIYKAIKSGLFEGITGKTHLRRKGKRKKKSTDNFGTIFFIAFWINGVGRKEITTGLLNLAALVHLDIDLLKIILLINRDTFE